MTGAGRPIEVKGGKGVVVGDYNTVFQTFNDGSRPVTSLIRASQFRPLVDERTKHFVGREFVFESIDKQLAGARFASGYVIVRGEPGIGKTAIAASLVARKGYVHHFNIASANIRSARQFLENVCAQLIVRYELDHETVPPEAGDDGGFLSRLLAEAAERAELPVVIVVDALDEAEDVGLAAAANRLYLPRSLPDGVFFVVTTREERDYRLSVDHDADIWIGDKEPENVADVSRYVEEFIDEQGAPMRKRIRAWGIDRAAFVDELTERSEGNFMYLVHVLPEIASGRLSSATVGDIARLPSGLTGYYQRHWREMKDADLERFKRVQRPVLCFLAISREPVGILQLAEWSDLEPGDVRQLIGEWREFLNEDAGPSFSMYHRSFAEFLDKEEDLRWYHDRLAAEALMKIPGFADAR